MVRIKICGITLREDALGACEAGADALGFIFWQGSKRYIDPDEAKKIVKALPPFVTSVGVFVDERHDRISEIVDLVGLDVVQLHGTESPEFCAAVKRPVVKAFRVTGEEVVSELSRYNVSAYLLDTYREGVSGGTGETFNWDIARKATVSGRVILAGGLTPENISDAVGQVEPYGVDVSSGVEMSEGKKDLERVRLFIERAREAAWV
ncbi:MAG: phosphoribosylanthranilate isomerase [Deltaproteobacteria bacterium]|nr:phosphoribosylanthranilate isomerase [Deltaproteobacteria bacterium]